MISFTGVVLVGGIGSRLAPLSKDTPKPLMPILGRPMLWHLLARLAASGCCQRVVLSIGYRSQDFRDFVSRYAQDFNFGLEVIEEATPLGTGGALRSLELQGLLLVLNGDTFLDLDVSAMLVQHLQRKARISIASLQVQDASRYGTLLLAADNRLQSFLEKNGRAEAACINAGAYFLDSELLEFFPTQTPLSLERDMFPVWLDQGQTAYAWMSQGHFVDIGTPADYLAAHRMALKGDLGLDSSSGTVPDPAWQGLFWLGQRVTWGEGVEFSGLCAIGDDCHIGAGSHLENCVIWAGSTIGSSCQLESCILGREVVLEPEQVLSRSMLIQYEQEPVKAF